jgi:transcriptional regulator with XRE-family HTH domain
MEEPTLGHRIKQARAAFPYSQRELAELVALSYAQLNRIERGHSVPRPATVRKIAEVLGVSARWLVSGDGGMRTDASE